MSTDELFYLQDWYAKHCNGDREHDHRVRISTLDNPGWRLWVNLDDTGLWGRVVPRRRDEFSDQDWLDYQSDGATFDAACGPQSLQRALAAFRAFAGSANFEM